MNIGGVANDGLVLVNDCVVPITKQNNYVDSYVGYLTQLALSQALPIGAAVDKRYLSDDTKRRVLSEINNHPSVLSPELSIAASANSV